MKSEYEEEHELNIENMVQDDDYKPPWKIKDATVATGLNVITYSSDLDENPAARKDPIKGSHLGKIVHHSEDGHTDMEPIVTGLGIIGKGGPRAISGGTHTQSIIQGGGNIICSNVITHVLTNSGELTLKCDSFPFNPLKA